MTKKPRPRVLGVPFDFIDADLALDAIEGWWQRGEQHYITFMNPYGVMAARRDVEVAKAADGAGLALPDGIGVILAGHLLGYHPRGRVPGPSFMLRLCDRGRQHGYRHFFYGGAEGQPEALAERLRGKYPGLAVAGALATPFNKRPLEDALVIDTINESRPDIVWVGIGSPRQEKWMASQLGRIEATVLLGVGAAFDFHSGRVAWAPPWVRRTGLEWAHRLLADPRRLWRRYLVDSPRFMAAVLFDAFF